jgi:uncharacterized surface protein with fasciclin (FAS1) repeats
MRTSRSFFGRTDGSSGRANFFRRSAMALALGATLLVGPVSAGLAAAQTPQADIVDTAVAAGQFTTLAAALQAAGLVDTLKGPGPFTVFAPTDAAFARLPAGTVDALLNDPETLREVLTYHVVAGAETAADVSQLQQAVTVEGEDVAIDTSSGKVMINDATVIEPDIRASNGVIHVIDTVLLPPSLAATPGA